LLVPGARGLVRKKMEMRVAVARAQGTFQSNAKYRAGEVCTAEHRHSSWSDASAKTNAGKIWHVVPQRTQNAERHQTDLQAVSSIWQRGKAPAQFQPRNQLKLLGLRHVVLLHEPSEESRRGLLRNENVFVHDHEARFERWLAVGCARVLDLCLLDIFGAEEKLKVELADMLREKRYIFKTAGNQTDTMLGQSPSLETTGKAERPRDSARKIVDMQIERAGR